MSIKTYNTIHTLPLLNFYQYEDNKEAKKLISCDCNKDKLKVIKHHLGNSYINHIIDEMIEDLKELRNDS